MPQDGDLYVERLRHHAKHLLPRKESLHYERSKYVYVDISQGANCLEDETQKAEGFADLLRRILITPRGRGTIPEDVLEEAVEALEDPAYFIKKARRQS